MKCKLCGIEKDTRRKMHGHLMHEHLEDYKRSGYSIERLCTEVIPAKRPRVVIPALRPDGFRLLNKYNQQEFYAIEHGYLFIDAEENLYTEEEAKAEAWV